MSDVNTQRTLPMAVSFPSSQTRWSGVLVTRNTERRKQEGLFAKSFSSQLGKDT